MSKRGFTILEVVIALGLVAVVMPLLMGVLSQLRSESRESRYQVQAAQLCEMGIAALERGELSLSAPKPEEPSELYLVWRGEEFEDLSDSDYEAGIEDARLILKVQLTEDEVLERVYTARFYVEYPAGRRAEKRKSEIYHYKIGKHAWVK